MAYLVLALGAFLSICGALSIYFGYAIVEVERGWTGVIAGATALSGGVITIALGFVLRALLNVRAVLGGAVPATPAPIAVQHDFEARREPEVRESKVIAAAAPAIPEPLGVSAPASGEALDRPAGPGQAGMVATEAESVASSTEPSGTRSLDLGDPPSAGGGPEEVEWPDLGDEASTAGEVALPELEPERPRPRVTFKGGLPREEERELEAPAMDDWLDRAFSAMDREDFTRSPHPSADAEVVERGTTLTAEAPAATIPAIEPETQPADPAPAALPAAMPRARPLPTSAVIGRYEADGTAYVMYADGSIEAHSETGVERFNSMAELKAFIESGA